VLIGRPPVALPLGNDGQRTKWNGAPTQATAGDYAGTARTVEDVSRVIDRGAVGVRTRDVHWIVTLDVLNHSVDEASAGRPGAVAQYRIEHAS